MRTLAVSIVVLLSQVARAEDVATAPTTDTPQPKWSVGAGIGLGESSYAGVGGLIGGLGTVYSPLAPTPRLSFERVFSEHFALGLGLMASYQSGEQPIYGTSLGSAIGQQSTSSSSVAVSVGPRWPLTDPASPIAFSLYAAATAGYATMSLGNPGDEPLGGHSFSFGINGGLAVERMLIDRLALRITAQMVRATLGRNFVQTTSTPTVLGSAVTQASTATQISAVPSPSIELRFYF